MDPDRTISENPLYEVIQEFINDELESYAYNDFYRSWNVADMNYRKLIQELFKINGREFERLEEGDISKKYQFFVSDVTRWRPELLKRLLRLILSLPICEYEMENIGNSSRQSNSHGSSCLFTKCFPPLKFRKEYLKEIGNEEIAGVVRKIISEARTSALNLSDTAFQRRRAIFRKSREISFQDTFKSFVVEPLSTLLETALNLALNVEYGMPATWDIQRDGEGYDCETDISIYKNNLVYCVIEVKKFPILPKLGGIKLEGSPRVQNEVFNNRKIKSFMKQLICQMLYYKSSRGILTDSYISIFLELDLDTFERNVSRSKSPKYVRSERTVPIRYKVRDCHSSLPTLRETFLYFVYESVAEEKEMETRKGRIDKLKDHLKLKGRELTDIILEGNETDQSEESESRPSTSGSMFSRTDASIIRDTSRPGTGNTSMSLRLEDIEEENETVTEEKEIILSGGSERYRIQSGDAYNTQLIRLETHYFDEYLLEPVQEVEIVAKIYDRRLTKKYEDRMKFSDEKIRKWCKRWYETERSCNQIMCREPEFNSCYIRQKRGRVMIKDEEEYVAKGKFNLFKYIEQVPLPKDWETYNKAKAQLDLIHKHGIMHNDIKENNIVYSKEGKVYIIDFALSKIKEKDDEIDVQDDVDDLKLVFYNLQYPNYPRLYD